MIDNDAVCGLSIPFFTKGVLQGWNMREEFSEGKSTAVLDIDFMVPSKGVISTSMRFSEDENYLEILGDFARNIGSIFKLYFTCLVPLGDNDNSCLGEYVDEYIYQDNKNAKPCFSLVSYSHTGERYASGSRIEEARGLEDSPSAPSEENVVNVSFSEVFRKTFRESIEKNIALQQDNNGVEVKGIKKFCRGIELPAIVIIAGIVGCIFHYLR